MKTIIVVLVALLIGIAIGVEIERRVKKNQIELRVGIGGEIIPYVMSGDTIKWLGYPSGPAGVGFRHGSICKALSTSSSGDTCVVADMPNAGVYLYDCRTSTCPDPGIGYGDNRGQQGKPPFGRTTPSRTGALHQVAIYCPGGTATADDVTVSAGDTIDWNPDPGTPQITAWTVSGLAGICAADSYTNASPTACPVTTKPTMPTHYTVTATGCTTPNGQANIQ